MSSGRRGEILIEGRWFAQGEHDAKANVCVIGDFVKESYFPYQSPIDETLEIAGQEFASSACCRNTSSYLAAAAAITIRQISFICRWALL